MHSDEKSRGFEMAARRPRGRYRLPLVAPSKVLESARGPIADSVQGRAPPFAYWLRRHPVSRNLRPELADQSGEFARPGA